MRYALLLCLAFALFVSPAGATIVHHCDYTPDILDGPIHEHHKDGGCSNTDVNTEQGHEGHCDHQTAWFWTDMDCSEFGCQMRGTIDCPGGDKSYNFECWGEGARAFATRTYADCEANTSGGGTYVTHSCSCDGPCS